MRKTAIASVVFASLGLGGLAQAKVNFTPKAVIGSTKGDGPGGCVAGTKNVRFVLDPSADPYLRITASVVVLDGKRVRYRKYPINDSIKRFVYKVDLTRAKPGRHRLQLRGGVLFETSPPEPAATLARSASTYTPPTRPSWTNGKVIANATITRCS